MSIFTHTKIYVLATWPTQACLPLYSRAVAPSTVTTIVIAKNLYESIFINNNQPRVWPRSLKLYFVIWIHTWPRLPHGGNMDTLSAVEDLLSLFYKCRYYFISADLGELWAANYLGAFVKLRKATVSFVISVCPSTCNNWAPTGRILIKIYIWVFFENVPRKFKFH
jgi:hypothetical protein